MIDEFLRIICKLTIYDFNERYQHIQPRSSELIEIASDYMEQDLVARIGYFFRDRATYERQYVKEIKANGKPKTGHNDLWVKSQDFRLEIKYPKTHKSDGGGEKNKLTWKQHISPDFEWLQKELLSGHKGKRAFVIGWFNILEFNNLVQLGDRPGNSPLVDTSKEFYFPFITFNQRTRRTDTIRFNYGIADTYLSIDIPDFQETMQCVFLGKETDIFHFAIYF